MTPERLAEIREAIEVRNDPVRRREWSDKHNPVRFSFDAGTYATELLAHVAELTRQRDDARRRSAGEFPDKRHRDALVEVITYHHRSRIEGCGCGWSDLGRSHSEHVADVYELQCRRIAIEAGAFL